MKNKNIIFLIGLIPTLFLISSCNEEYEAIAFEDATFTYSGEGYSLSIDGTLPEGVTVSYSQENIVNVGTYTITANFIKNDRIKFKKEATLTINKAEIEKPTLIEDLFVYDGATKTASVGENNLVGIYDNFASNVGSYQAIVYLKDKDNYCWKDGTTEDIKLDYCISESKVEIPTVSAELVYNGSQQDINLWSNYVYTITYDKKYEAGTYEAYASLNDKENYSWSDGSKDDKAIQYTIKKKVIEKPVMYSPLSFDYDGESHTIFPHENEDFYSISNTTATDAGLHKALLTLKDSKNYIWFDGSEEIYELEYVINKQKVTNPEYTTEYTFTYDGQEHEIDVSHGEKYEISQNKATNAGVYNLVASLKDKTNYCWEDGNSEDMLFEFVINRSKIEKPTANFVETNYNGEDQYVIDENTLYDGISLFGKKAGNYQAVVSIKNKDNYCWSDGSDSDLTFDYKINKIQIDKPTLINNEIEYTGFDINVIGGNSLYTVTDGTKQQVGSYKATISLIDTDSCSWKDGSTSNLTLRYKIVKATKSLSDLGLTFEDLTVGYDGNEHELLLTGNIPNGITPVYNFNKLTELGSINAYVTFIVDPDCFEDINDVLYATLTIEKGTHILSNWKFEDKEYYFDETTKELVGEGTLPDGVEVSYFENTLLGHYNSTDSVVATAYFTVDETHYNRIDPISAKLTVKPKMVTVTYDVAGGKEINPIEVYRYSAFSSANKTAEKTGYSFDGWLIEERKIENSYRIENDISVKANYSVKSFTLNVNDDYSKSVTYGESYSLEDPRNKEGYEFDTFYISNAGVFYKISQSGTWDLDFDDIEINVKLHYLESNPTGYTQGVKVSALDNGKIEIKVSNIQSDVEYAYIYPAEAYEYYHSETYHGLSTNFIYPQASYIGIYKIGSSETYTIDRIASNGRDYYYSKYYICYGDEIINDPQWVTSITPTHTTGIINSIDSKKGITIEKMDTETMELNSKIVDAGLIINGGVSTSRGGGNQLEVVFNGDTFYINQSILCALDAWVKYYYDLGSQITMTLYLNSDYLYPEDLKMTYPGAENSSAEFLAINTSTRQSSNMFGALITYLTNRYSSSTYGYIDYFVLGNEIDVPTGWNAINDGTETLPMETYTEEYYREMRIASLAMREVSPTQQVLVPFTHNWGIRFDKLSYAPCIMAKYLLDNTLAQGNFDWGLGSHGYPQYLNSTDGVFEDTKLNSYKMSEYWYVYRGELYSEEGPTYITITNLEFYQYLLSQDRWLSPSGNTRPVVLTEVGISTGSSFHYIPDPEKYATDEAYQNAMYIEYQQAASIAYTYYKIEMIDVIKGWVYYHPSDGSTWEGCTFGFMNDYEEKKYSWYMYKDIDEVDTNTYSWLLNYINYMDRSTSTKINLGIYNNYLDAIIAVSNNIGTSSYVDWASEWEEMKQRLKIN